MVGDKYCNSPHHSAPHQVLNTFEDSILRIFIEILLLSPKKCIKIQ